MSYGTWCCHFPQEVSQHPCVFCQLKVVNGRNTVLKVDFMILLTKSVILHVVCLCEDRTKIIFDWKKFPKRNSHSFSSVFSAIHTNYGHIFACSVTCLTPPTPKKKKKKKATQQGMNNMRKIQLLHRPSDTWLFERAWMIIMDYDHDFIFLFLPPKKSKIRNIISLDFKFQLFRCFFRTSKKFPPQRYQTLIPRQPTEDAQIVWAGVLFHFPIPLSWKTC